VVCPFGRATRTHRVMNATPGVHAIVNRRWDSVRSAQVRVSRPHDTATAGVAQVSTMMVRLRRQARRR